MLVLNLQIAEEDHIELDILFGFNNCTDLQNYLGRLWHQIINCLEAAALTYKLPRDAIMLT